MAILERGLGKNGVSFQPAINSNTSRHFHYPRLTLHLIDDESDSQSGIVHDAAVFGRQPLYQQHCQ